MAITNTNPKVWIRSYHSAPNSRVTLVCFPHAGGSASYFFPVSAALAPDEVQVLAIQYPGRQDRRSEPCVKSIDELAGQIYEVLAPQLRGPFAFFGHSMGAALAFEVARKIETRGGQGPAVLFVSGRRAPSRTREESVHLRDDAGIVREMRALGGTDTRVFDDPDLLEMVMPALRADYEAIELYRCGVGATISSPIAILTATDDPKTTVPEAQAWQDHTSGEAELHTFTGGHFYLETNQPAVISLIGETLRKRVL
jgi:pyochelin biosynthesis protein PchC